MAQTLLPITDLNATANYAPSSGTAYFEMVDDASESGDGDATYMGNFDAGGFFRVELGVAIDPQSLLNHRVKALVKGSTGGGAMPNVSMNIGQNGAFFTYSGDPMPVTSGYTLYEFNLSPKQVAAFDYGTTFEVTCIDDCMTGQAVRWTRVWVEVPDPPAEPMPPPTEFGGDHTMNPLLDADGFERLCAAPPTVLIERGGARGGVIASAGPRRETRRTHERTPPVYRVRLEHATPREMDIIRQAITVTRGGSMWTRWRSPDDPPPAFKGDVTSAPMYRVLNSGIDGEFGIERGPGGVSAAAELVLEKV